MPRKLIVGNWKMNGKRASLTDLATIADASRARPEIDVGVALPATLIASAAGYRHHLAIGAQDVHSADSGAHTGCISAAMVLDSGATFTLVGHSERRSAHTETGEEIKRKVEAARRHGLSVIVCVGETAVERASGKAEEAVAQQLAASLPDSAKGDWVSIAYEPVWAIGTNRTPSIDDIAAMHGSMRQVLEHLIETEASSVRLLYGGSVSGENASEVIRASDVDGVLVGGASLRASEFVRIIAAVADRG